MRRRTRTGRITDYVCPLQPESERSVRRALPAEPVWRLGQTARFRAFCSVYHTSQDTAPSVPNALTLFRFLLSSPRLQTFENTRPRQSGLQNRETAKIAKSIHRQVTGNFLSTDACSGICPRKVGQQAAQSWNRRRIKKRRPITNPGDSSKGNPLDLAREALRKSFEENLSAPPSPRLEKLLEELRKQEEARKKDGSSAED